ncbi:hypothetical protein [Dethiosulfatarculus sandiegensis]|uniref:hypothetical protein n=1 Tax=Dethiosulfatarculus sandiegensis TaxID=1429043 RepID=UPI0012E1DCEC|nr:hypothetical protein [Dethiosulfatarculus sandiegensis]
MVDFQTIVENSQHLVQRQVQFVPDKADPGLLAQGHFSVPFPYLIKGKNNAALFAK